MSKLFFDTETSGLVQHWLSHDHPSQPHIIQLAAMVTDNDGAELNAMNVIIRPEGWEVQPGAAAVHGISTERAMDEGVSLLLAIEEFTAMTETEEAVGHNIRFDQKVVEAELARLGHKVDGYWPAKKTCTMLSSTNVCRILNPRGGGYKWPKLTEAYLHFFGLEMENAHDAMADVRGCKEVYFEMVRLGHL